MRNSFHFRSARFVLCLLACGGLVASVATSSSTAADSTLAKVDTGKLNDAVNRAADYFKQAQAKDGSFSASSGTGVTSLVGTALLRSGRTPEDPVVAKILKYLESNVHADGGIYQHGSNHKNYETCVAVVCFHEANRDHRYDKLLANAEKVLKKEQWDETEGKDPSDLYYGGAGYGKANSRPDLSNTSFLVDALHSVGVGKDDPAMQKALIFVSRCQNLESADNTSPFAAKVNDGGFYYTVAAGGSSPAGKTADGGLRSYGSMTYSGLKSMIYAGVTKDDPRVKAAVGWIEKHYTLDDNPGMGMQGLYYYYHTFAKALAAIGNPELVDSKGKSHDWRDDLADKLIADQKPDGSWVNRAPRWLEGDPNLVTAYALICLSYCREPQAKSPPINHIFTPDIPAGARKR
ncbi:MAG TPA: prenyltransferase/squalene oxidase repeat-containing protein [Lacipirellulaceae bacterium]|nr:prenyltransferase/squalene oxidase repeat-containing protein [Lacipirellulaceae bacterium]